MGISLFLKGLIMGISIAAPLGPIGILCIQRTLSQGRRFGFVTGLGTAAADSVYGLVAGFGLTAVSNFLVGYHFWIQFIGAAFLLYLGMTTLKSKPVLMKSKTKRLSAFNGFLSSFLLTLTNPMTILTFAAIFGAFGFASESNPLSALFLVSGVFCGSSLWWLLISSGAGMLKSRANEKSLALINRISGAAILLFGVFFLLRSLV